MIPQPEEFEALTGFGIRASYKNNEILVGSRKLFSERGIVVV